MKNDKIALHGSYYGDNFGDTLFVKMFSDWILESKPSSEIYLPYAGLRVRSLVESQEEKGYKAIKKSDRLIFIGGGYLGERRYKLFLWNVRFIIRHFSIVIMALLFKKKFIFVGVGAGPLSSKLIRKATAFMCNKSEGVIVRDRESYNFLISIGVNESKLIESVDSVLLLDESYLEMIDITNYPSINAAISCGKTIVGLHLPIESDRDKLVEVLDYFVSLSGERDVFYVIFNDFYNEKYTYFAKNYLSSHLKEDYLYVPYANPDQLIGLISQVELLVTTKLHVGIVGNCLNKYTISIPTHDKINRLYKQLGLDYRCVDINDINNNRLNQLIDDYFAFDKNSTNVPPDIKEKALNNREYVRKFIND